MRTTHAFDYTKDSPGNSFQPESAFLNRKIANITSLVTSLNAAVEDLESLEVPAFSENFDFYHEVERFETSLIKTALRLTGGSQVKAARLLKLNPTTLNAKMKTLRLLPRSAEQLL
jgi:DNA-binding NtrC family response regulator